MAKEIERKWLIAKIPDLTRNKGVKISQGYLVANGSSEVRVRKSGNKYELTVKKGDGISRDEINIPINSPAFNSLWALTDGMQVFKFRHEIALKGKTLEVDIYSGDLLGLHIVEVEFTTVEEAMKFDPPGWFGKELTGDKRYSNRVLAEKGLP